MGTCQGLLVSPRLIERKRDGREVRTTVAYGRGTPSPTPDRRGPVLQSSGPIDAVAHTGGNGSMHVRSNRIKMIKRNTVET